MRFRVVLGREKGAVIKELKVGEVYEGISSGEYYDCVEMIHIVDENGKKICDHLSTIGLNYFKQINTLDEVEEL